MPNGWSMEKVFMRRTWCFLACAMLVAGLSSGCAGPGGPLADQYRTVKATLDSLPVFGDAKIVYRHDQQAMVRHGEMHRAYLVRIYEATGTVADVYRHYTAALLAGGWEVYAYGNGETQGREARGARCVFVSPEHLFPDRLLGARLPDGRVRFGVTVALFPVPGRRDEAPRRVERE